MAVITAAFTEMKNNFGKYLGYVIEGKQVVVTKNGKEAGRFIPKESEFSYLTDSLRGILKGSYDLKKEKGKALSEKNEASDRR